MADYEDYENAPDAEGPAEAGPAYQMGPPSPGPGTGRVIQQGPYAGQRLPEIYNQGERGQMYLQPDRPHESGMVGAEEFALSQTHHNLSMMELSPAERTRLGRLQQGVAGIQQQVDNGEITPDEGAALARQVQQQAQPLMVRASQIPLMRERLNQQLLAQRVAAQTAMNQHNEEWQAGRIQNIAREVFDPRTGQSLGLFTRGPNGQLHPVGGGSGGHGSGAGRQPDGLTGQNLLTFRRQTTNEVRNEVRQATATPRENQPAPTVPGWLQDARREGGSEEQIILREAERRIQRHRDSLVQGQQGGGQQAPQYGAWQGSADPDFQRATGQAPPTGQPTQTAGQPGTPPVNSSLIAPPSIQPQPIRSLDPEHVRQLPEQQRVTLSQLDELRQELPRDSALMQNFNQLQAAYLMYGDLRAMPPELRQQWDSRLRLLADAATRHRAQQAAAARQSHRSLLSRLGDLGIGNMDVAGGMGRAGEEQ